MLGQGHAAEYIVGTDVGALGEDLARAAGIVEQPGDAPAVAGQFELDALVPRQVVEVLRSADARQVSGVATTTSAASSRWRAIRPESGCARTRMARS